MSDEVHGFWSDYLRLLADRLGLRDWRIMLYRDPCANDQYASVSVTPCARELSIRLSDSWSVLAPDDQRRVLIHELLHAHLHEVIERVGEIAAHLPQSELGSYLPTIVKHEIEHAVDAISEAIAPLLPVPDGDGPCRAH